MVHDALEAEGVFGMIQPFAPQNDNRPQPGAERSAPELLPPSVAPGTSSAGSKPPDGRYMVQLRGISRFRVKEELTLERGYRRVLPDYGCFADLAETEPGDHRPPAPDPGAGQLRTGPRPRHRPGAARAGVGRRSGQLPGGRHALPSVGEAGAPGGRLCRGPAKDPHQPPGVRRRRGPHPPTRVHAPSTRHPGQAARWSSRPFCYGRVNKGDGGPADGYRACSSACTCGRCRRGRDRCGRQRGRAAASASRTRRMTFSMGSPACHRPAMVLRCSRLWMKNFL